MDIQSAIRAAVARHDLSFDDMRDAMRAIMSGDATQAQIAGFLIALRMKGETIDEIAAAASVMRELAVHVEVDVHPLIDTCGTGGDGIGTFNISTAAAFVTAAAGGYIAKHGNRAASGASGSADVLEAAGACIDLAPSAVATCIREVGVGFMFAPAHHGATRHAAGPRRELGTRTLFNVLGPLTNPANAGIQLMGVFDRAWVPRAAQVLARLGVARALVVCAEDGMDEISIASPTHAAELRDGRIECRVIDAAELGIPRQPLAALAARNAAESCAIMRRVFDDEPGPAHDIVSVNAGAALYLAGLAPNLADGLARAREVIASGAARAKLTRFVSRSQELRQARG
jgi:anthranilate phosphoribosyltransferase